MTARARLLPLEGGRNFRDLGGYTTRDGRRVRWGRLYRSGVMSYFSEADHARLEALGVRAICDLRTAPERAREPTRWPGTGTRRLQWDYDPGHTSLRTYMQDIATPTAEASYDCMLRLYTALPRLFADPYAALFAALAAGDVPLVFHCSAGKDRTGLAAALVLTALDVPFETILDDYVLTDTLVDLEQALFQRPRGSIGVGESYTTMAAVPREARLPLLRAHPDYLRAAFDAIAREHGSVEQFLGSRLGVDAAMRDRLQTALLER